MPKTYKTKTNKKKTKTTTSKNYSKSSSKIIEDFQKEITVIFLEILLTIKLYHWKTYSYATHKATDQLYEELNESIDKFIEVLLGEKKNRINLMNKKSISLNDLDSQSKLENKIESYKKYFLNLNNNKAMNQMLDTGLFNIRDEILEQLNQFLYLLTFK